MILAGDLSKSFGDLKAANNVCLEVRPGEIFAFLGTNGAGKTTTIRMLTGALKPDAGEVSIAGVDMIKHPIEAKKKIGVVPDRPQIYPFLSAEEFLNFVGDIYQVPRETFTKNFNHYIDHFGLKGRERDLISTYSHGMKQRLMTCAALIHDPEVLIIDEPLVGLDPIGASLFKQMLKERAAAGVAIFMSTHTLGVAEELATNLAIINKGSIIAQGTLDQLYKLASRSAGSLEELFIDMISFPHDSRPN